tara:strand:- start:278 stop:586 length:309 start_codon:yes stop_codon:yes gene_type:complete
VYFSVATQNAQGRCCSVAQQSAVHAQWLGRSKMFLLQKTVYHKPEKASLPPLWRNRMYKMCPPEKEAQIVDGAIPYDESAAHLLIMRPEMAQPGFVYELFTD